MLTLPAVHGFHLAALGLQDDAKSFLNPSFVGRGMGPEVWQLDPAKFH